MAIAEVNDPCLTGEINRYRKEIRAARALRDLEAETRAWMHKISQEREVVEKVLKESMRRLEQAGVYEELLHRSRAATPLPLPPHTTPLLPRKNGPTEMPILAGEENHTKCYRCHSLDHVVSRCPKPRCSKGCSKCSSKKHRTKWCSIRGGNESPLPIPSQEQMTLTKRIALMDKPDWAPALCKKCFRHNPGHTELNCPQYEQCQRCYSWGPRGSVCRHACCVQAEEDEDMDYDVDADIYQGRD